MSDVITEPRRQKGGPGYGGIDNKGGDVFLSTFLSMGCGGGYYGAQMHWNTMQMSLDWVSVRVSECPSVRVSECPD